MRTTPNPGVWLLNEGTEVMDSIKFNWSHGKDSGSLFARPIKGPFPFERLHFWGCGTPQRNTQRLAKFSAQLFFLTTLLAFFDSLVGTNVSFLGFQLEIKSVFAAALCFVTSSAFLAAVFTSLDVLLIDNYLATIGRSVGMYSFGLYVLPRSAVNLWAEAFTPKFFGPVSAGGHKTAMGVLALLYFALMLFLALYPTIVCGNSIWQTLEKPEKNIAETSLAAVSFLIIVVAWVVAIGFAIRSKFKSADFDEADGTPSKEFIARIKRETELATKSNVNS